MKKLCLLCLISYNILAMASHDQEPDISFWGSDEARCCAGQLLSLFAMCSGARLIESQYPIFNQSLDFVHGMSLGGGAYVSLSGVGGELLAGKFLLDRVRGKQLGHSCICGHCTKCARKIKKAFSAPTPKEQKME